MQKQKIATLMLEFLKTVVFQVILSFRDLEVLSNFFNLLLCVCVCVCDQSCLTLCNPHGNFPGKNTAVGCHFLLQGIFLTQRSNPSLLCLLHWQADSLPLRRLGSPFAKQIPIKGEAPPG